MEADLLAIKKSRLWTTAKHVLGSFPSPWNRYQSLTSWILTSSGPGHYKAVKCHQPKYPTEPDALRGIFPYSSIWNYYLHLCKSKTLVSSTLKCLAALGSSRHLTTCPADHRKSQLLSSQNHFVPGSSSLCFFILHRLLQPYISSYCTDFHFPKEKTLKEI